MTRSAPNINHFWADLIVEELVRNGVTMFFIAPGSRSAPLVSAVVRNPTAQSVIHFDERGTAFAALGYGRATGRPAVWITTSGTAAANGLPAVVEAAQSGVPLMALTADRPHELRDTGANQAIDQIHLFGAYPRWFFDLPAPSPDIDPAFVLTTIDQAIHRATDVPAGPVHLNCPYREPLAPDEDGATFPVVPSRWSDVDAPYTTFHRSESAPAPNVIARLRELLRATTRGLVVVGELRSRSDAQAIADLASDLKWPVVADITSQLRLGAAGVPIISHPHFVCAARLEASGPEVILRFGGPVSSKEILEYVDRSGARIVSVSERPERRNPGHTLTEVVRTSTVAMCEALKGSAHRKTQPWLDEWGSASDRVVEYVRERLGAMDAVSEPGVAASISRLLPEHHALFAASSMPIRDLDMFAHPQGPLRRVAANRGASGIDGTIASAFGYHLGSEAPMTILIGDLALLHDLNSLALLHGRPVVVVAVNNGGGGIFHFLPIAAHANVFEPSFTSPHAWSFGHAAAMFGIAYEHASDSASFDLLYQEATGKVGPTLIEVTTERESNRDLHREMREGAVAAARGERT